MFEFVFWEFSEKFLVKVEGFEDVFVFVIFLGDEFFFEFVCEFEVFFVGFVQSFFIDDCDEVFERFIFGVGCVELLVELWVVFFCFFFIDIVFYQMVEGWKNVNWWVDIFFVEFFVENDLFFGDVIG